MYSTIDQLKQFIHTAPSNLHFYIDTAGFVYFNNEEGSEPGLLCQVKQSDIDEAKDICNVTKS